MLKKILRVLFSISLLFAVNNVRSAEILLNHILQNLPQYIETIEAIAHTLPGIYEQYKLSQPTGRLATTEIKLNKNQLRSFGESVGLPIEFVNQSIVTANNIKLDVEIDNSTNLASVKIGFPVVSLQLSPTYGLADSTSHSIPISQYDLRIRDKIQIRSQFLRMHQANVEKAFNYQPSQEDILDARNQQVFNNMKVDKSVAFEYLIKMEQFCELLICTNSTDSDKRIQARLALPFSLDHGPMYEEKRNAIAFLTQYFYDNDLKVKTEIIPELTDKIVSLLARINKAQRDNPELYNDVYQGLHNSEFTHISPMIAKLLEKAKANNLYDIEKYPINPNFNPTNYWHFWRNNWSFACNVMDNEENFKLAQKVSDLVSAFDIDQEANYKKAEAIFIENVNNPIITQTYQSLKNKYQIKISKAFDEFKNDPLFKTIDASNEVKQFDKHYELYLLLHKRHQLKTSYMEIFGIPQKLNPNYAATVDKVLYELIGSMLNPQKQEAILLKIAQNKSLSPEVYKTFYLDNGILKSYRHHPFAKVFQLNFNLDENNQNKVTLCINKALSYKSKSEKEAQIIRNVIGLIDQANKNPKAAEPCLEVTQCSIEALNGNKEFEFLLSKPEQLKPQDIMEAYKKIQQKKKAKLIPTNLNDSSSTSPSPEDPEKFKDKDKKHKYGIYKDAPYHKKQGNAVKSKAPTNGQEAVDNSIPFTTKGSTGYQRRLAVQGKDEFVVLDETLRNEFHGHVRTWDELEEDMQRAFQRNGLTNSSGRIIKKIISKL